jgi:hypothetical protein
MSLTKSTAIDLITVAKNGEIYIREATTIVEDGVEISKSFHRSSLRPGQDLSDQPDQVMAIAQATWTPEIVAAYQLLIAPRQTNDGEQV